MCNRSTSSASDCVSLGEQFFYRISFIFYRSLSQYGWNEYPHRTMSNLISRVLIELSDSSSSSSIRGSQQHQIRRRRRRRRSRRSRSIGSKHVNKGEGTYTKLVSLQVSAQGVTVELSICCLVFIRSGDGKNRARRIVRHYHCPCPAPFPFVDYDRLLW